MVRLRTRPVPCISGAIRLTCIGPPRQRVSSQLRCSGIRPGFLGEIGTQRGRIGAAEERVFRDDAIAAGTGLEGALRNGVFCELGTGDSGIDSVIEALRAHDYAGWLVIEQDQFLMASDTPASVLAVQRANREYLRRFGI